jgi:bifunctional UDP-N-acetylglucosamine pyrophosphorylase/glucosamine-1-phosphate N-acetyltransferase
MDDQLSVVILAAGLGTRMKSKLAKVLHRAGGAPLVEHVVRAAATIAAPERTVAVVGHQAEHVQAALAPYGIAFATQDQPRGTGHALKVAREAAGGAARVVVLYGDCPLLSAATLGRLVDEHARSGCAATVITTNLPDPTGYGRILRDETGAVRAIVEQKAASEAEKRVTEINSGIYCFQAAALWPALERVTPNPASGEYYLTDIVELLRADGQRTVPLVIDDATEILGINTRVELAEADRLLRLRKVRELMLAGVTVEKPETVTVDLDVEVGPDTVIEAFTQLLGRTRIGSECTVGACSILRDAELDDNARIFPFSTVEASRVGRGAEVGPYARLRMGAEVADAAHVGNFVELKKTRLGAGSKAMHLAYLGDATIGKRVNIGAGTITCNYDGKKKHPTVIHDGAFIGSNSTLVAPAEVGAGAYVAAASIITKTVPADALAIGRAHQVNREGWAKVRREKKD